MPRETVPELSGSPMSARPGDRVVIPADEPRQSVSRRRVLLIGFWTGVGAMLAGIASTIITSLYPPRATGFGSKIFVGMIDALEPGAKAHNLDAKTWLVRLDADQARRNPPAQAGAVLALYHKCPHLGCTVPYRADFAREDPRNNETYAGWFLCPCHGSTYSDAGVRVFGPAPRSMDMFPLTIDGGRMTVDTGRVITGTMDNPSRAVLPA